MDINLLTEMAVESAEKALQWFTDNNSDLTDKQLEELYHTIRLATLAKLREFYNA